MVIKRAAWDTDGHALALAPGGAWFWDGQGWRDASHLVSPLGGEPTFVERYEAGGWLVGGRGCPLCVIDAAGVHVALPAPAPDSELTLAAGRVGSSLVVVERRLGQAPTLWCATSSGWLKPLALSGVAQVNALSRLDERRWLVGGRLEQGGGSKDYAHTKAMLYGAPSAAHALLDKLARTCASYLEAQVAAGADTVQIFDSWGGIVSPGDFREYPLRYARQVIELLRASPTWKTHAVPIIYFVNGCAPYLDDYASSGADVLGVDWRVGIDEVRRRVGDGVALQGNLDPGALFAPPAEIRARVADILERAGSIGHVFNLGHGVLPETDPEHVRAMVVAVRELSATSASGA